MTSEELRRIVPPDVEGLAAAEARVRELEEAVRELAKGWRWSKSQPDNPIARDAVAQQEVE